MVPNTCIEKLHQRHCTLSLPPSSHYSYGVATHSTLFIVFPLSLSVSFIYSVPPPLVFYYLAAQVHFRRLLVEMTLLTRHDVRDHPIRSFIFGWPFLLVTWVYTVFFVRHFVDLAAKPISRPPAIGKDGVESMIDPNWFSVLMPFICLPVMCLMIYVNWIGWKSFRHN